MITEETLLEGKKEDRKRSGGDRERESSKMGKKSNEKLHAMQNGKRRLRGLEK